MLDLTQIEGFEWDDSSNRKNVEKHDVSQQKPSKSSSTIRY
jgi:uncharacterized DUF497 family protein